MPQPLNAKAQVQSTNLTPDQLAAIGHVGAAWAHVELALALVSSKLSGADLVSMFLIMSNMTARGRIDTVGALGIAALDSKARHELSDLLTRAKKLSTQRNTLAHGAWCGVDQKGRAVMTEISARQDKASICQIAYTVDEIRSTARALDDLWRDLNQFLIRHNLWNGTLFE